MSVSILGQAVTRSPTAILLRHLSGRVDGWQVCLAYDSTWFDASDTDLEIDSLTHSAAQSLAYEYAVQINAFDEWAGCSIYEYGNSFFA